MDAAKKPSPVNLSGAPPKPGLKAPDPADAAQVKKLGAGDQVKYKAEAGAEAGGASAKAESSVAVKKTDGGQYEVSTERSTAVGVGLSVPQEPQKPGAPRIGTTPVTPGRSPGEPIIGIGPKPKPDTGPGGITVPRPGGLIPVPGGPGIVGIPGITTQPGTKPEPGKPEPGIGLPSTRLPGLTEPSAAPEEKKPDVEIGAKTGSTVTYTFNSPQEAARAAELLRGGKVASPDEAAAVNRALSSQEVQYSSTAKPGNSGLSVEREATTAFKVNYENGRPTGTELKSELALSGSGDLHGVGLESGDKVSFTTINKGGQVSYESGAEVSGSVQSPEGVAKAVAGAKTEYKFSDEGTEVSSYRTSEVGAGAKAGPASVGASVELEDRIYHSMNGGLAA